MVNEGGQEGLELLGVATFVLVLVVLTALLRVVASVTAETAKNITWIQKQQQNAVLYKQITSKVSIPL